MKKICEYVQLPQGMFRILCHEACGERSEHAQEEDEKKNAVEETEDSSVTELSPSWNNC